jgi:hypothetical protein
MLGAALLATTAAMMFASVAAAKAGDKTFAQTYPYASKLCDRAAAGTLPKKLRPQTTAVMTDCAALRSSFNTAVGAVQTAHTTYANGLATAKATRNAACVTTPVNHQACKAARIVYRATVKNLAAAHRLAVKAYYVAVESARRTFWAEIRVLRGGATITPDGPIAPQNS